MLKYNIPLCFFLVIGLLKVQSQEIIDYVDIRICYEFSYKTDKEQPEYVKIDLMYLDVGQNASKFYSRNEQIRDSVNNEGLKKGLLPFEINEQKREYTRGTRNIYYNFLNDERRIEVSNFSFLFVYYSEMMQMPNWKIGNTTENFLGYTCQSATTHYLGRDWTVLFSTEIALNQGPWKLWGLPGLIVKVSDRENLFRYEMKSIEKADKNTPILYVDKSYDGKKYLKSEKNTFRKMERFYYEDNNEFMRLYLGANNITITRADGTQRTGKISIPHIPLEPW